MEKVRFEAFNVEELRVLRRACYEAGAAFGDPGHTAAERATLDDLAVEILGELKKKGAAAAQQKQEEPVEKAAEDSEKGTAERLPFAPKAFQKPEPQKKRMVQRPDILEMAKAAQPAESAHRAPEPPVEAKFTGFLYVALRKMRPGTRLLRKDTDFLVLLPGVRRENGAQKYAPGQDLVRVRQRLPVPHEYPGRRI